MSIEMKQNIVKKRCRGRPKGSAKFEKTDMEALRKVAEELVQNKHLTVTKLLRKHGYAEDKDLYRLRRRWRKYGKHLLQQAHERHQTEQQVYIKNIAEYFSSFGKKYKVSIPLSQIAAALQVMVIEMGSTSRLLSQIDFKPIVSQELQTLSTILSTIQPLSSRQPDSRVKSASVSERRSELFKKKGDEYYAEAMRYLAKAQAEWKKEIEIKQSNEANDEQN